MGTIHLPPRTSGHKRFERSVGHERVARVMKSGKKRSTGTCAVKRENEVVSRGVVSKAGCKHKNG